MGTRNQPSNARKCRMYTYTYACSRCAANAYKQGLEEHLQQPALSHWYHSSEGILSASSTAFYYRETRCAACAYERIRVRKSTLRHFLSPVLWAVAILSMIFSPWSMKTSFSVAPVLYIDWTPRRLWMRWITTYDASVWGVGDKNVLILIPYVKVPHVTWKL